MSFLAENLLGRRIGDDYVDYARRSSTSDYPADGEDDLTATPTATELVLPWKRDDYECPLQQNEFPAWAKNREYLAYNSPSTTFLGQLSREDDEDEHNEYDDHSDDDDGNDKENALLPQH